jgi:ParB-like chromosome segregation protein Spo0J
VSDEVRIEYLPLAELKGWPRNPKEHHLGALRESFERFGVVSPVVIDERTGRLVAGHGRIDVLRLKKAAGEDPPVNIRENGKDWLVPVVRGIAFETDAEVEAYILADNRIGERGGWNAEKLDTVLAELHGVDALFGTGFDRDVVARKLRAKANKARVVLDQAVQLMPQREYIVVMCEDADDWEWLKEALELRRVRRGGYPPGSPRDLIGTERVIPAKRLRDTMRQATSELREALDR